ncbi:MAG: hypothetical protein ACI9LU_000221 [Polaribacter sp.]
MIHSQDLRRSLTGYDDFIRFVQSQYDVFSEPITQTEHTLMQASSLHATGLVKSFNEIGRRDAVDRQMLFNSPQMMTALQTAYAVQESIHAFLSDRRAKIVAIQAQIRAEQEPQP